MGDNNHGDICLVIDVKKSRFRVYKSALHNIEDPKLIQLLFNPTSHVVLIKSVDHAVPGGQEIKVLMSKKGNIGSFEFYSKSLIKQMCAVDTRLKRNHSYRITGDIIQSEKVARFAMNTMTQILEGSNNDES